MTPDEAIAIVKKRYPPEKTMSYGNGPLLEEVLVAEIERLRANTPRVRQLEWKEITSPHHWIADSGFGTWYSVEVYANPEGKYTCTVLYAGDVIGNFDDPERAKEFAQSDFIGMVRNATEVAATS